MRPTLRNAAVTAGIIGMIGFAGVALAANTLTCFSGTTDGGTYGGTCTIAPPGTATLALTSSNPNGDYAGVYFASSTLKGQTLSSITQLGYHYTGTKTPTPGELSLNFLVSTSTLTPAYAYAYVDAFYCPGTGGTVDVIHDPACGIWFNGVEYANWAAFVAAFPGATMADVPFIVAERTPTDVSQTWVVNNLQLGGPTVASSSNKDACKNGGWQNLVRADQTSFKNQGDCIQYVNTGK